MNIIMKGQLQFLNKFYEVIGIASNDNKHFSEMHDREGIRLIALPLTRKLSILKDIFALFKLIIILRKEKPSIIHSITPKAGIISMLGSIIAGVPIRIHTFTGLVFPSRSGLKKIILKNLDRLICICATNIYPEGEGVKNDLITYRITSKKLVVIANGNINGVDTEFFKNDYIPDSEEMRLKIRSSLGITKTDIVFIFVGRICFEKGIRELIKAVNEISKSSTYRIKLLLIGLIDDNSRNTTIINDLIQSNKNIIYLGRFDDVRPYYLISDVHVHPSYREGFPNTVLEAGAMGLPSIATDINGCNEIIKHNVNGFLITPKSSIAIQETMQTILTDPVILDNLGKKARANVVEKYKRELVWRALAEEYNTLLQKKRISNQQIDEYQT